jgi:hypothetical protein
MGHQERSDEATFEKPSCMAKAVGQRSWQERGWGRLSSAERGFVESGYEKKEGALAFDLRGRLPEVSDEAGGSGQLESGSAYGIQVPDGRQGKRIVRGL